MIFLLGQILVASTVILTWIVLEVISYVRESGKPSQAEIGIAYREDYAEIATSLEQKETGYRSASLSDLSAERVLH